jgi:hypothetical protein
MQRSRADRGCPGPAIMAPVRPSVLDQGRQDQPAGWRGHGPLRQGRREIHGLDHGLGERKNRRRRDRQSLAVRFDRCPLGFQGDIDVAACFSLEGREQGGAPVKCLLLAGVGERDREQPPPEANDHPVVAQRRRHGDIGGDVEISGNVADSYGGGITIKGGVLNLSGKVKVTGNTARDDAGNANAGRGGGLFAGAVTGKGFWPVMTVAAGVTISGNTAETASGGGGVFSDNTLNTITIATGAVTDNTPDQCAGQANSGALTCA